MSGLKVATPEAHHVQAGDLASKRMHRTSSGSNLGDGQNPMSPTSAAEFRGKAEELPSARDIAMGVLTSSGNRARLDELVREGVIQQLVVIFSRRYSGDDHLIIEKVTAALRIMVMISPRNALIFHDAVLPYDYAPFLFVLENTERENVALNVLAILSHAARHEAGCSSILSNSTGLQLALQSLKGKMQFPKSLAFRKNHAVYRAFADFLIAVSSNLNGMMGHWERSRNLRDAGVYQLLLDLCDQDLCLDSSVVCRLLESLELVTEDPETGAHFCSCNLDPLHKIVLLCKEAHKDAYGEEGGNTGSRRSGSGINSINDRSTNLHIDTDSTFGSGSLYADMSISMFSRAFRVLRNLSSHLGSMSKGGNRKKSIASLSGDKSIARSLSLFSQTNASLSGRTINSGDRVSKSTSASVGNSSLVGSNPRGSVSSTSSYLHRKPIPAPRIPGGIVSTLIKFVLGELRKPEQSRDRYRDFTGELCQEVAADFLFVLCTYNQVGGKPILRQLPVVTPHMRDREALYTELALLARENKGNDFL